jgi:2-polyprenyl-6-methoxyphenol hydroxylase-like FAD-dependent oxidoreductase
MTPTHVDASAQVLIIGAGPVGLTLAIDLGRRGVTCIVAELQVEPRKLPKMERCNSRTMEIFRRLGVAGQVREAGAPADARMDCLVVTSLADEPLVRFSYPSVAEALEAGRACNDGSLPLEPQQLVSQYSLEPLLRAVAESTPNVTVLTGRELISFEQEADGVTARLSLAAGGEETVRAAYMVGADGGRSTVRKQLGIPLSGDGGLARRNQVFFRCDALFDVCPFPQGRLYFFANEDQSVLSLQDSMRHFVFHTGCWGDEAELRKIIGETLALPLEFEILATTGWNLHLLVADHYTDRRVFLAGDSAHLMIPTGGLGLNTGIGDAIDLSWKLAGALADWGGPHLLESYEVERRSIGLRNTEGSRYASLGQRTWQALVRPNIREDTPEGRGVKAAVTRIASVEQRKSHEQYGTELGYRYEASPIVWSEPGEWFPDTREVYVATGRPGARLPHAWLADGSALHDHLSQGYTLLRLRGGADDASALIDAMRELGAPLTVIDLDEAPVRALCGRDLLLVRPDLHVCWRGDKTPADPRRVAAIVTGHLSSEACATLD